MLFEHSSRLTDGKKKIQHVSIHPQTFASLQHCGSNIRNIIKPEEVLRQNQTDYLSVFSRTQTT